MRPSTYIRANVSGYVLTSNNALERTVNHDGRTVRAFAARARAGAQWRSWPAVQLNR
jgi:hypothetical protein